MKNITFSADEELIEAARERARSQGTTLNEEFRRWLAVYARQGRSVDQTMKVLEEYQQYFDTAGPKLTRAERNDRSSAEERLLREARELARQRHTTVSDLFFQWLEELAERHDDAAERAMAAVDRVRAYTGTGGRKFSREEMNER